MYTDTILNNDGSITYRMNDKQYKKLISDLIILDDDSINEMIDDEYGIIKIIRDDNFTEFEVIVNTDDLPKSEELITSNLYYMGKMYQIYNNSKYDSISIKYYNNNSEKIIYDKTILLN